jgi:hypothetical protein
VEWTPARSIDAAFAWCNRRASARQSFDAGEHHGFTGLTCHD